MGPSYIRFVHDSAAPVVQQQQQQQPAAKQDQVSSSSAAKSTPEKFYSWTQSDTLVNMHVNLTDIASHHQDKDVGVAIAERSVQVTQNATSVFESGELYAAVCVAESTWKLNAANNTLELCLVKADAHAPAWPSLLRLMPSDVKDEPVPMAGVESKSLFSLEQQLEECDGICDEGKMALGNGGDEAAADNEMMLRRMDAHTHRVTHKSFVNENKFLFELRSAALSEPAALCLRHDVDAILWQPHCLLQSNQRDAEWLTHEHTFLAFGYVQASKQEAKYRSCAPDRSYVCVVDARRHVYVYVQSVSVQQQQELRNRKTGKLVPRVAKQFLVTLDSDDEVHGLYCANKHMILILHNACHIYRIC